MSYTFNQEYANIFDVGPIIWIMLSVCLSSRTLNNKASFDWMWKLMFYLLLHFVRSYVTLSNKILGPLVLWATRLTLCSTLVTTCPWGGYYLPRMRKPLCWWVHMGGGVGYVCCRCVVYVCCRCVVYVWFRCVRCVGCRYVGYVWFRCVRCVWCRCVGYVWCRCMGYVWCRG